MRIGYNSQSYAEIRNILGIVPQAEYVRTHDLNELLLRLCASTNKLLKRSATASDRRFDRGSSYNDFDLNRIDILHFFNTISFSHTPWVTTFETIVPRFMVAFRFLGSTPPEHTLTQNRQITAALGALSNKSCKKLIAMSECNLNMQRFFLHYFPTYQSEIEAKLVTLHPPQEIFVDKYDSKPLDLNGEIIFTLVGRAFFRKGGMEIVETFREMRLRYGYNLRLVIVSSLKIDNYATKETEEDVNKAKHIIETNRDWIDYYYSLPNREVMEVMRKSHIGLLPTYADTYGYSVLEFQASGCPVISTNVRALPEINNNQIGWLIDVPKNFLGEAIYSSEEDRLRIKGAIKKGLEKAVSEIFANRDVVLNKGNAAIRKIRDQHSTEEYSRKLGEIYYDALKQ